MRKFVIITLSIGVLGLVVDFLSKLAVLTWLENAEPIPLLGGLATLRVLRNPGAAFSMGEQYTPLFACFAIIALIAVLVLLMPRLRHVGWAVGTGLLIAGISGNLLDRLIREPGPFFGHVIDFIQVPYFAVFNFADICITFAAVVIIWLSVISQVSPSGVSMRESANFASEVEPGDEPSSEDAVSSDVMSLDSAVNMDSAVNSDLARTDDVAS